MKKAANKPPLSPEEWNFRRCPENERAACLQYEYAREHVFERPALLEKLLSGARSLPYDNLLRFVYRRNASLDNIPMFCADFPASPWLGLSAKIRAKLIALCRPLPEEDASNCNLLVEDGFEIEYLQELNETRETLLADWKKANRDQDDRFFEAVIKGFKISEESIPFPPFCGGPKRYYAVAEDIALAVIRLD